MIRNLNFTIDESLNNQKKIGLIVLASDYTIDEEFRKLFPIANLDYYQARIENSPIITPETLSAMKIKISSTLKLILPGDKLDICLLYTSPSPRDLWISRMPSSA